MSRIYVSTRQAEEHRIVIEENGQLVGFEQDIAGWENKKGDIYKAVVTRVEEGLDAAFVDFGEDKNGFLPLKNISPNLPGASGGTHKVAEGDSILVQIKKDHVGGKGSGLTTGIALAGCYLVLMPNHRQERAFVSKSVTGRERQQTMQALAQLDVPDGMSVIVRTAGVGRSLADLRWDLESYLLKLWRAIESAAEQNRGPILIYRENNLMLRAVRDYFRAGKDEIFCDDSESYAELKNFVTLISPEHADDVYFHEGEGAMIPVAVERQIDAIYEREIKTPSGARVVFDSTEAMFTIDVNSGQMRGQADIEETALRANMDAADVIARHLRLRDMGGLVVVDFIDMTPPKNRAKLEEHIASLLRRDRARVQWSPLSRFGLMELSRQRLSRPVEESQSVVCNACHGTGRRRRPESFALRLLGHCRAMLQNENGDCGALVVQAPADTAVYLLNEKRVELRRLEDEHDCEILIAPAADLHPPDFNIRKVPTSGRIGVSYQAAAGAEEGHAKALHHRAEQKKNQLPQAVIKTVMPDERQVGFLSWLGGLFGFGDDSNRSKKKPVKQSGRGRAKGNRGKGNKNEKRARGQEAESERNKQRGKARVSRRRTNNRRGKQQRSGAISAVNEGKQKATPTSGEERATQSTAKNGKGWHEKDSSVVTPMDEIITDSIEESVSSSIPESKTESISESTSEPTSNAIAESVEAESTAINSDDELHAEHVDESNVLPPMDSETESGDAVDAVEHDDSIKASSDSEDVIDDSDSDVEYPANVVDETGDVDGMDEASREATDAEIRTLTAEYGVDERMLIGALLSVGCDVVSGAPITDEDKNQLADYFARRKARAEELQTVDELKMVETPSAQLSPSTLQAPEVREIAVSDNMPEATPAFNTTDATTNDLQQVETKSS